MAVGGAVQRDASREGEAFVSRAAAKAAADVEQDAVETFLKRGGEVAVLIGDFSRGWPSRDEVAIEVVAGGEVIFALVAGLVEAKHRDADRAIVAQDDFAGEEIAEAGGITIRREAHDFVLVGIEIEAEVERDQRIENPDGILRGGKRRRIRVHRQRP